MATDKNFVIKNGLTINGSEVITSAGNLTNIGTISSGAITASTSIDYPLKVLSTDSFSGLIIGDNSSTTDGNAIAVVGDSMRFYTGGTTSSDIALTLESNNNATFAGQIHLSGSSSIRSNNGITFNTLGGAAQKGYFKAVAAQTSYANGASDGMFNALNGYAVGTGTGTTVIDASRNLTNIGTISSGAITSTGILTLDTSPASNGVGDLVVIPSLNLSAGVGYAGQVFGVNVKNAVHSTNNAPQVASTWGGVTGATAIAIQADDNSYGQFQVWTAAQDSSADDLLIPRFWINGSGNATFAGTI